ncbi:MAG: hypothetical protein LBG97_10260, partial [Coriobacteriales bacterium]|nr:hypothetical protein [Coriobacteriales bacterium]
MATSVFAPLQAVALTQEALVTKDVANSTSIETNTFVETNTSTATSAFTALYAPTATSTFTALYAPTATSTAISDITVSAKGDAAKDDDANFAISDFVRLNKGTAKEYNGKDFGYRYPLQSKQSFAAILLDEQTAILYINKEVATAVGYNPNSEDDQTKLIAMLTALDDVSNNGGKQISALNLKWYFVTDGITNTATDVSAQASATSGEATRDEA